MSNHVFPCVCNGVYGSDSSCSKTGEIFEYTSLKEEQMTAFIEGNDVFLQTKV